VSNVTQYPAGLLDLLKVRDRGQMPSDLAQVVGANVDLTPFYLLNIREVRSDTQPGPTSGGFNVCNTAGNLNVPAGEIWYVHSYLVAATLDAGETIELAAAIRLPGNVNQQVGAYYRGVAATQSLASSFAIKPFWAPPGADFGCLISALTVAPAITVVAGAQISRLRA